MSAAAEECLEASLFRCGFCSQDFLTLDSCLTHLALHTAEQDKPTPPPASSAVSEDQQQLGDGDEGVGEHQQQLGDGDEGVGEDQQQLGYGDEGVGAVCSAATCVHADTGTGDRLGSSSPVESSVLNSLIPSTQVSPAATNVNNTVETVLRAVSGASTQQTSVLVQTSQPQHSEGQASQQDTFLVHAQSSGAFIIDSKPSKSVVGVRETRNGRSEDLIKTKRQAEKLGSETVSSLVQDDASGEVRDACEKQSGSAASSDSLHRHKSVGCKTGGVRRSGTSSKSQASKDSDRPYACSECPARYRFLSSLSVHKKRHSGSEPYQCKTCWKKFWHPTNLRVHERVHSQNRLYNCSVCGHGFNQSNDLRIHMRIHTGEMPLKCPVEDCSRAFRDPACLRRHMNKHRGVQPHIACDQCSAKFYHPSGLARHYKRHTGQKDHVCTFCNAAFARADTLKLHMRIHSGHKPYTCSVCGQSFSDRSYCRRHVAKHDESQKPRVISTFEEKYTVKKEEEENKMEGTEDEDVAMEIAQGSSDEPLPRAPTQRPAVKVPIEIQVPNSSEADIPYASIEIEIPECDLVDGDRSGDMVYQYGDMLITISRSAMGLVEDKIDVPSQESNSSVTHQLSAAATSPLVSLQQTEHQYSRASGRVQEKQVDGLSMEEAASDRASQVTSDLNPVMVKTGATVPQPLSEFNEIVTTVFEADLVEGKEHPLRIMPAPKQKQRTPRVARFGDKRWPCPDCNAAFFHQAELKRHQTKHTGELPYQCNICGKKVRDPSNLKRHVRTHTGERPYSCYICGKTFRQAGHLSAHVRIHTGQRPYRCNVCPATFIEANHLRYHQKVHAGIKPYQCPQCDLSFIRNAELKRHSHVHAQGAEGNLQCHLCPAKFFRSDALRQHLSKRHDQNLPYQCDICSQSFCRQSLLDRHCLKMNHSSSRTPGLTVKAPESKSDAENSVVADALCELAAGGRSASVKGCKASGRCPVSDRVESGEIVESAAATNTEPPVVVVAREEARARDAACQRGEEVIVMEGSDSTAGPYSHDPVVHKVVVDGGSVSGARIVLVESEAPPHLDQLHSVQYTEPQEATSSQSGTQPSTHQLQAVSKARLEPHRQKSKFLVANSNSPPKPVPQVLMVTNRRRETVEKMIASNGDQSGEPTVILLSDSVENMIASSADQCGEPAMIHHTDSVENMIASSADQCGEPAMIHHTDSVEKIIASSADQCGEPAMIHHTDSVEKLPEDSLIPVIVKDNMVSVKRSESEGSPGQVKQVSLIKQETADNTEGHHSLPQSLPEASSSEPGVTSAVQAVVSWAVELETGTPGQVDGLKPSRGRPRKGAAKMVTVKQEPKNSSPDPSVAPLRTRSGRERKVKVKLSL